MNSIPSRGNPVLSANADQAEGLRRIFASQEVTVLPILAPGGQQGSVVANLAMAFKLSGREVLVVDVSRGEVPQAMGLRARYELAHVVAGDKRLQDIVLSPTNGLRIVPAARALSEASNIDQWLAALAGELTPHPQIILLYHQAPINGLSGDILIAASPLADVLTRTYAALKRIQTNNGRLRLLVCAAAAEQSARNLHRALHDAAQRFIGAAVDWAGFIPQDDDLTRAQAAARLVFDIDAQAPSAQALMNLVAKIDGWALPGVLPSRTAY